MTNMPANASKEPASSSVNVAAKSDGAASASDTKQIVLKEIGAKWSKFSAADISGLKGKDDLIGQVVAKYGLEKGQAQRDVDALLKGRQF